MPPRKMSDKHQLAAYLLNKELGYSQAKVGELMEVSQGTVANAVKEAQHKLEKHQLQQELKEVRQELETKGYLAAGNNTLNLPPVIDVTPKDKPEGK